MATFDLVILSSSPPPSSGVAIPKDSPPSNQQRVKVATFSPAQPSPLGSPIRQASDALKSDSRAVPIPDGAVAGFATAGTLVKSHHYSLELGNEFGEIQQAQSRRNSLQSIGEADNGRKKPRKRSTKSTAKNGEPAAKKPRARKSKANKDGDLQDARSRKKGLTTSPYFAPPALPTNEAEIPPNEEYPVPKAKVSKPRKLRAKENAEKDEAQTKSNKARVTKPKGAAYSAEDEPKRKTTGTVSAHFQSRWNSRKDTPTSALDETSNPGLEDNSIWEVPSSPRHGKTTSKSQEQVGINGKSLELDEAVARRKDWTPIKDSGSSGVLVDSAFKENDPMVLQSDKGTFTNLLSSFAHAQNSEMQNIGPSRPILHEGAAVMKRRRIELVDVPGNQSVSRNTSPKKGKVPKKKARTITDLVTAQYDPKNPANDTPPVRSEIFCSHATTVPTKPPAPDLPEFTAAKPIRKRSSSKKASDRGAVKSKRANAKHTAKATTKTQLIANKLLSPTSAALRMDKQDILFGTSSQLVREESPTLIREIQKAIRESEQDDEVPPGFCLDEKDKAAPCLWPRWEKIEGKRGLWAAGARDEEGMLLEKEDIYMPEPDRAQDLPILFDGTVEIIDTSSTDSGDSPLSDVPSCLLPPSRVTEQGTARTVVEEEHSVSFDDIDNYTNEPPTQSNRQPNLSFLRIDDFPPSTQPTLTTTINSRKNEHSLSFEDIDDYTKELPPQSDREGNLSFLDIDDFPPSTQPPPTTATSTGSPKKRRGRPRKSESVISRSQPHAISKEPQGKQTSKSQPSTPKKTRRFDHVEEILDSEDDEALSPTPPRQARLQDSPPLDLHPSQSNPNPISSIQVEVFKVPAKDLEWSHIKTKIFSQISAAIKNLPPSTDPQNPTWHEKILLYDPIILEDITEWLNRETRIRVWKRATKVVKAGKKCVTIAGGGEEMVDVVYKELETWMVQGWCQEMSICCVEKEKKRSWRGKGMY
ncbi:hypothetical protein K469DRAFT_742694 [Zopfia rhizophila CBS 207.26]|uniref:Structure-specific endonuclease subunit SLX4 n=1 Tax=Zopfia rhizophila CBS 207.26 TaxID=1314779 RepID=A0A6A6DC29_9PEZI|nr:hypothetical protein K469DRAFT_742694 [Zopfia rhizophila CBS 207.26]